MKEQVELEFASLNAQSCHGEMLQLFKMRPKNNQLNFIESNIEM